MIDITKKPYFIYNDVLRKIAEPIEKSSEVKFLGITRYFRNNDRFIISCYDKWTIDYYTEKELFRYGLYEKQHTEISSIFHMWDHLPKAPPEIYKYFRDAYSFDHGLTIIQQSEDHCDEFVFVSHPKNNQVNNFYLNNKELFIKLIDEFYFEMAIILKNLAHHTFSIPQNLPTANHSLHAISKRQRECCVLLLQGLNTKEIGKSLNISPRTVEEYIDVIKTKTGARNRPQLANLLAKYL